MRTTSQSVEPAVRGAQVVASERGPVGRRRWVTLGVLCVSLLVVNLDSTILNVAMPTIVRDLHASSSDLQWTVDVYAVVFAGLLLVLGSLGDRVGRKRVFVAGLILFALGSAASAFSGTPHLLIAARGVMGMGAAAIMPSTLSILTNVFVEERDRAWAIGIWSGTTGLGVAVGPIAGGWLLAHFWWGSVFLVNVPIIALGLVASIWLVPDSKNPSSKRPDPLGALLSLGGMGLLLWGIIEAPNRTWESPLVLGALGGAALVLGAFVVWERHSDHPLLELSFFASRRFSAAMGSMALVLFALAGVLFLLTQYLQFSLGYSALQAGLRIGPLALILVVVAPTSSLLARWLGTKPVVATGMALIAVGLWLLSRTTVAGTYRSALPAFLLLGLGAGLAFAPSTESVMGSLPRTQAGAGSATNSTALQLGGALGVGVLGSLLASRYQGRMHLALAHQPVPASVLHVINGSLGGALEVAQHVGGAHGTALAEAARRSFMSGMDLAMTVGAVAVAAGAMVVLAVLPSRADQAPEPSVVVGGVPPQAPETLSVDARGGNE
jgi:EmrB/QacA subfamily drug resistance transporter